MHCPVIKMKKLTGVESATFYEDFIVKIFLHFFYIAQIKKIFFSKLCCICIIKLVVCQVCSFPLSLFYICGCFHATPSKKCGRLVKYGS